MSKSMTVAVIGARSFVGVALCAALEAGGHTPLAFTREKFDVTDPEARFDQAFDVAVFLAQDRNYTALDVASLSVFDVNTVGVLNSAIKARDAGARGFLFASTGNVYAPSFDALSEDAPLARSDIYSTSKIFAEQILELAEDDLTICRPRLFGAYGPHQTIGLVAGLTNRVRSGQPVTAQPRVSGVPDGGFAASLTHVDDIATGLIELAALALDGPLPSTLNLAAPDPTSIESLAHLIGEAIDQDVTVDLAEGARSFDLVADTTRLQGLLSTSFRPTSVGIAQALAS